MVDGSEWWIPGILTWLEMVKQIREGMGSAGVSARTKLDFALDGQTLGPNTPTGPGAVYRIYSEYQDMAAADRRRQEA